MTTEKIIPQGVEKGTQTRKDKGRTRQGESDHLSQRDSGVHGDMSPNSCAPVLSDPCFTVFSTCSASTSGSQVTVGPSLCFSQLCLCLSGLIAG